MTNRMRSFAGVATAAALLAGGGGVAFAHGAHKAAKKSSPPLFVQVVSKAGFGATVSALKHSVASNGMMVLGTLNQKGALSTTGLHLKGAESFFVGNPVMGKKFFQMDPAVGTEVPVRVFVWVNPKGKTELGYYNPQVLFTALNPHMAKMGAKMAMMIGKIVQQAAK